MKEMTNQYYTNIRNIRAWCENEINGYVDANDGDCIDLEGDDICVSDYTLGQLTVNFIGKGWVEDDTGDCWDFEDITVEDMLLIVETLYDKYKDE